MIKGLENKEYYKAYREANKDKIAKRRKAYYEANKDKIAKRRKAYYEANKEYYKAYREANKDKIKAYYEANKDKIKAYHRDNYISIPLFGFKGRARVKLFTNGFTEEAKKIKPKLINKVLNDCIKNPRKYLGDD